MADATYYAWSPIRGGKRTGEGDDAKVEAVNVAAGETVTASKLGVSKEEFQALVDSGAVRTQKYPDLPEGYQDSPVNFMRQQALEAAGDNDEALIALSMETLGEGGTPQASPARPIGGAGAPTG